MVKIISSSEHCTQLLIGPSTGATFDPCKNLLAIAARSLSKSRGVFGRISRRDRCVNRGAMGAIAARSLTSIA